MSPFGAVLKDVRGQLGLSQAALAGELSTTQRHISFLETGRSNPTPAFLTRLCRELGLSVAQRANLFEASGLHSPYERRRFDSAEIAAVLDMIENRILAHWPFPALVLDTGWNIMRRNAGFDRLFGPFLAAANSSANFLDMLTGPQFRGFIENWSEVAPIFYFRLQAAAAHDETVARHFAALKTSGLFDTFDAFFASDRQVPPYVPVRIAFPDGTKLEMTSFLGRLASAQDALVEGFEIEFLLPTDAASERVLSAML